MKSRKQSAEKEKSFTASDENSRHPYAETANKCIAHTERERVEVPTREGTTISAVVVKGKRGMS